MRKFTSFVSAAALLGSMLPFAASAATIPLSQVGSGDLVRGTTFNAVYYVGKDGFRYVFPNDKTYFTWYSNFNTVKMLSDADLAKIQIGGNVTYKPGVKMLKINSDPKTYALSKGGTLRWVTSEAVAVALYGADWNKKIDDVPDAFFGNYKKGADLEQAGDLDPVAEQANVDDINDDKSLRSPTFIDITDNQFSALTVTIPANSAVKFTNKGASKHTATGTDLSWGSGTLESGQNFSRYFKTPGTYTYFCSYHPSMSATIIVQ